MSRGLLPDNILREIAVLLPDVLALQNEVLLWSPDALASVYPRESTIPNVVPCIADALHTMQEVRHALHEYYAHGRYYREITSPPNEPAAVFFARYYLDDAAFRLYSAGEHTAAALQAIFDITEAQLAPFLEKQASRQAVIGRYVVATHAQHALAMAVTALVCPAWQSTMRYRNLVVHDQPPRIPGTGITHDRTSRWHRDGDRWVLPIGGGDPPVTTIVQIAADVQGANRALLAFLSALIAAYRDELSRNPNLRLRPDGITITWP